MESRSRPNPRAGNKRNESIAKLEQNKPFTTKKRKIAEMSAFEDERADNGKRVKVRQLPA